MIITGKRLEAIGFKIRIGFKWADNSISDCLYIKGEYFIEFTNCSTIIVFAKFIDRNISSVHLRNVTTMRQVKRLYNALTN